MIRFKLQAEPANFDSRCRKRGLRWLRANPCYEGRPCDYWSEFEPQLRDAFKGLCGYCAMLVMKAHVDHFIPVALLKVQGKDTLAYEWSNYRYGEGILNQKKGKHKILDPFEVGDDWFEVLLPSLQLVITPNVPRRKRKLAEFTLEKLGLRDSEVVVRYRREWFKMYQERKLTLDGLRQSAPLVARAVERELLEGRDWRLEFTTRDAGSHERISGSATKTSIARKRSSPTRGTSRTSCAGRRTSTSTPTSTTAWSSTSPRSGNLSPGRRPGPTGTTHGRQVRVVVHRQAIAGERAGKIERCESES